MRATVKTFRWEIPYQCIVQLAESEPPETCPELPEADTAAATASGAALVVLKKSS